jgi:hypothetical protein
MLILNVRIATDLDDGYSDSALARPGVDHLRDAARNRELEGVLVTEPERLTLNYVQPIVLPEQFARRLPSRLPRPPDARRPGRPASSADPRRDDRV